MFSVKIEVGRSTEVPVSEMEYFVHLTGCAIATEVETVSARRKDVRVDFIGLPEIGRGWSKKRVRSSEVPVAAVCWGQIHLLADSAMWFSSEIWRDDRDRTTRKYSSWARGEKPPPSGRGSVPRKGANGPALRSLLYEEAVSFSLSTFTLDIDGKPMLVLRTKWQADANEICRAWYRLIGAN